MSINSPRLRAGKLRQRAELQKLTEVPDGSGGWTTTWTKDRDIWCRIRPTSGAQRLESMRRDSQVSHEIFTRFTQDITTGNRIAYKGRVYTLNAIWSPDEREEYLQIVATEGAPS